MLSKEKASEQSTFFLFSLDKQEPPPYWTMGPYEIGPDLVWIPFQLFSEYYGPIRVVEFYRVDFF